jgi:Ca2+-binding EF-hand superfamily protein
MIVKHYLLLPAMAAALGISAVVVAADSSPSDGPESVAIFARLDANQDGKLTADEVPAERKQLFDRLIRIADEDGDGALGAAEFEAGLRPRDEPSTADAESRANRRATLGKNKPDFGQILQRLDANGDGKVTLDEVPDARREQFNKLLGRLDKNGDEELSSDEFPSRPDPAPAAAQRPAETPQDVLLAVKRKGKPGKGKGGDAQKAFSRLDKNGDGKLTADEAPADRPQLIARLMSRADKDNDQAVSLAEFAAVDRERMQQGGAGGKRPDASPANKRAGGAEGRSRGLIAVLDTDQNGKLSNAEISAAVDVLRKLDTDGDGELSPREIVGGGNPRNP